VGQILAAKKGQFLVAIDISNRATASESNRPVPDDEERAPENAACAFAMHPSLSRARPQEGDGPAFASRVERCVYECEKVSHGSRIAFPHTPGILAS
jgi:hypothetical protein